MFYVYLLHSAKDNGFYRVKSFASRGLITLLSEGVLCVCFTVRERFRFLHRLFHGLEEAVVGAYTRRLVFHEIARSMEADLL